MKIWYSIDGGDTYGEAYNGFNMVKYDLYEIYIYDNSIILYFNKPWSEHNKIGVKQKKHKKITTKIYNKNFTILGEVKKKNGEILFPNDKLPKIESDNYFINKGKLVKGSKLYVITGDNRIYTIDECTGQACDEITIEKALLLEIARQYKYRSFWQKLKDLFS